MRNDELAVLCCVALEVNLCTLRKKALASLLTATTKDVTASFSSHACAETVLALAGTLRRLVSAFAHDKNPLVINWRSLPSWRH